MIKDEDVMEYVGDNDSSGVESMMQCKEETNKCQFKSCRKHSEEKASLIK